MNKVQLLLVAAAATVATGPAALAADLPVKAPVSTAAPYAPYNWTGLYVGGNVGGSWGAHDHTVVTFSGATVDTNAKPDGVIGGGQIGYNWQTGSWVFGLEADIQGSGQKDTFSHAIAAGGTHTTSDELDYFGTVRGRVGYAWDRHLLYATGGWAYGRETIDSTTQVAGVTDASTHRNDITDGWTVGGGWEWAFADRWSVRVEYLYVDFGSDSAGTHLISTSHGTLRVSTNDLTDNIVRVGLNYKLW